MRCRKCWMLSSPSWRRSSSLALAPAAEHLWICFPLLATQASSISPLVTWEAGEMSVVDSKKEFRSLYLNLNNEKKCIFTWVGILTDPISLTHTPGTWPLPPALCHLWIPAPLLLLSSPWPRQESLLGHTVTATVVPSYRLSKEVNNSQSYAIIGAWSGHFKQKWVRRWPSCP